MASLTGMPQARGTSSQKTGTKKKEKKKKKKMIPREAPKNHNGRQAGEATAAEGEEEDDKGLKGHATGEETFRQHRITTVMSRRTPSAGVDGRRECRSGKDLSEKSSHPGKQP